MKDSIFRAMENQKTPMGTYWASDILNVGVSGIVDRDQYKVLGVEKMSGGDRSKILLVVGESDEV